MKAIIGICGSIAAYKSLELIRLLKREGVDVKVILTKSALNFITPLSAQALSTNEVLIDQFILTRDIKHIALSQWADILVVGPATANIIGKAACGIGDDLLSTTILSFEKPILFVPAMDTAMWQNKVVQRNVKQLVEAGLHFLEPASGFLASGRIGKGRFPDVTIIFKKIISVAKGFESLRGKKFLISGGRTEEDLDPVRVITNRSSGRMARELLYAVTCRDGKAKGIFGEISIRLPEEMEIVRVRTSEEMLQSLKENIAWCDCLIMSAAIGDYKPGVKNQRKIHNDSLNLKLARNKDLLKELSKLKDNKLMVGFSLEDAESLKRGREKMVSKGLDLVVLNSVEAIARDEIEAKILKRDGGVVEVTQASKWQLANKILDECVKNFLNKN